MNFFLVCLAVGLLLVGVGLIVMNQPRDRFPAKAGLAAALTGLAIATASSIAAIWTGAGAADDRIAAIEERYNIRVDEHPAVDDLEKPGDWKINGEWNRCYVTALLASEGLRCADPAPAYKPADFVEK